MGSARIQALLTNWIGEHEIGWGVMVATKCRTRVATTRVSLPDVVLVSDGPQPDVLTDAPILNRRNSFSRRLLRRHARARRGLSQNGCRGNLDHRPQDPHGRFCVGDVWIAAERLIAPGTSIYVELKPLFDRLDRKRPTPNQA